MSLVRSSSACLGAAGVASFILLATTYNVVGQTSDPVPGGWIEMQGAAARPQWSASQIQSFVPPTRGSFTFPAPYNTRATRLTDASDCGGQDCVYSVGYAYWRNINNHVSSNEMLIFLSFDPQRGGSGATLFSYNKLTEVITKVGPLFPAGNKFNGYWGGLWYFSATMPTTLYVPDGPRLLRYDVISKQFETVFDITAQFGANRTVFQTHSSNDDKVHSATLQATDSKEYLGCFVYSEITRQYRYYAKQGTFDECHIDKSGRYLMILEGLEGRDNVFIDLQTGTQTVVSNENGGVGHADMGFGYVVGAQRRNTLPNAATVFSFAPTFVAKGPTVFHSMNWKTSAINHISHGNAQPGVPFSQQFACGSGADRAMTRNEILCFRLDGSAEELVVAPVMTDLNAAGGKTDYFKLPKGNLDVTGQYFIWTSNLSGNRLDAFLVKVPSQLLFK